MKTIIALAAATAALAATGALAGGPDVKGRITGLSVSGIVTPLSQSADDYSATVANVREKTLRVKHDLVDLESLNATAFFEDGYKKDGRGIALGLGIDADDFRIKFD